MTKTVTISALRANGDPYAHHDVIVTLVAGSAGGVVGSNVVVESSTVKLDANGAGSIVLRTNDVEITSPSTSFYRFTVKDSSPTITRSIRLTDDLASSVSWTLAGIQVADPTIPQRDVSSDYITVPGGGSLTNLIDAAGEGVTSWTPTLIDASTGDVVPAESAWGRWSISGGWCHWEAWVVLANDVADVSSMLIVLPAEVKQDSGKLRNCGAGWGILGTPQSPGEAAAISVTGGDLSGAFGQPPGTVPANWAIFDHVHSDQTPQSFGTRSPLDFTSDSDGGYLKFFGAYEVEDWAGWAAGSVSGPQGIQGEQGPAGDSGGGGVALGETSTTAYRGDRGKDAYDHSQVATGNPHGTTAADVGAAADDDARLSDTRTPTDATVTAAKLHADLAARIPTTVWADTDSAARTTAGAKADDSELKFAGAANTRYRVDMHLQFSGDASADVTVGVTGPTGATCSLFMDYFGGAVAAASAVNQAGAHISTVGAGGAIGGGVIASPGLAYRLTGWVQLSSTAGDVSLYWGPTSNGAGTGVIRHANSHLIHTP